MFFIAKTLVLLQLSMQVFYGIILGVVQGIAEWLPVSSKTQVLIVGTYLMHLTFSQAYTLGLFMEIGTVFAAIIYFRRELWSMIKFIARRGNAESKMLFMYVLVSMIFTGIIAVPIYLLVDSITGTYNLGIPMLIIGVILIGDALLIWYAKSKHDRLGKRRKLADLGIKDYVMVGIVQGVSALPGISRSGAVTSSLLLLNVDGKEAFRLSFLNAVFATTAAVALTLVASHNNVSVALGVLGISGLVAAIIVSTLVSLVLIRLLLRIAGHSKIVYLTAALGVIAIIGGLIAWLY